MGMYVDASPNKSLNASLTGLMFPSQLWNGQITINHSQFMLGTGQN